MERPVKFYAGVPERTAMCRNTKKNLSTWLSRIAQHRRTKMFVEKVVARAIAPDAVECIAADTPGFARLVGIPADDLRVLLQYQENLLYSCEKWKQ